MSMNGGSADQMLRIRILDVGQGDAIVVILPGGERALVVDAYDGLRVSQVLDEEGIREVVLFLSHSDEDHVRGVGDLIDNMANLGARFVALFYNADRLGKTVHSKYVSNLRCLAGATRGSPLTWSKGFDAGLNHDRRFDDLAADPVTVKVLHPTYDERMSLLGTTTNEASGVLRIACKCNDAERAVLLTGDVQLTGISCMMHNMGQTSGALRADVLKFPHHGAWPVKYDGWAQFQSRRKRGLVDFLEAVDPAAVVLSVGRENAQGHVKREVFDALDRVRSSRGGISRILCTQLTDTCLNRGNGCGLTACAGDIEVRMGPGIPSGIEVLPPADEHQAHILVATTKGKAGCGPLLP